MAKKKVLNRVFEFNAERDNHFVRLKYNALLENPFRFFRGTCHLFYEDLAKDSFIFSSPRVWLCGDLHLENFGSFRGVHRLYFDMNDFDEAFLGPCLLDIVRLCTSIYLISYSAKFGRRECREMIKALLLSYSTSLQQGEAYFLEQKTACGFLMKFLEDADRNKRRDLLQKKMRSNRKTRLKCDNIKSFKASKEAKRQVKKAIKSWAEKNLGDPAFFKVKDVVHWAGGTGSIGLEKYLVLLNGSVDEGNYLLSLKESTPPTALKYLRLKQPAWHNHALRVTALQRRVQAALPIFFSEIAIKDKMFIIKEKQPEENKVNFIGLLGGNQTKLVQLMHDMGSIIAWNNLRSGGRQGSAIADELIKFGNRLPKLEEDIIDFSEKYAAQTVAYWKEFRRDYKPES